MRAVCVYASGCVSKKRRICGPVNRSYARDPVSRRTASAPPSADSIARHCGVVLSSIQTGDAGRENTVVSCGASACGGLRSASACCQARRK
jgi:hypothetical protein